jgi:hypothetical protein
MAQENRAISTAAIAPRKMTPPDFGQLEERFWRQLVVSPESGARLISHAVKEPNTWFW